MKKNFNLYKLSKREQNNVKGGYCGCSCVWANCGGSSTMENGSANTKSALFSPHFEPVDGRAYWRGEI